MTADAPGGETWKAHTTAFDRVRSVAVTLDRPRSADWVAEQALVAENTARDHLARLVEMNVLQTVEGETAVRYRPDPLYTRLRALRDLLDSRSRDELIELRAELQERLESWREEYGVESSEALRERAAGTDTAEETRTLREVAGDWDIVQYRLALVTDAIEHYSEYSDSGSTSALA